MEEKGQTVDLWIQARVMTLIKGPACQHHTRQKDRLIRGRVRGRDRARPMDRPCLPDISCLNAGVRL